MRTFRAVMVVVALAPIAKAQADLFNVVRFGTLDEVTEALEGATGLTDMVDSYGQDLLVYAANSNPGHSREVDAADVRRPLQP
jgi:hypothetical protein